MSEQTSKWIVGGSLFAYWLGSSVVIFDWTFYEPHTSAMDREIATGLALLILFGWSMPLFVVSLGMEFA